MIGVLSIYRILCFLKREDKDGGKEKNEGSGRKIDRGSGRLK